MNITFYGDGESWNFSVNKDFLSYKAEITYTTFGVKNVKLVCKGSYMKCVASLCNWETQSPNNQKLAKAAWELGIPVFFNTDIVWRDSACAQLGEGNKAVFIWEDLCFIDNHQNGWYPEHPDSLSYIIAHEVGHCLDPIGFKQPTFQMEERAWEFGYQFFIDSLGYQPNFHWELQKNGCLNTYRSCV